MSHRFVQVLRMRIVGALEKMRAGPTSQSTVASRLERGWLTATRDVVVAGDDGPHNLCVLGISFLPSWS